CADYLGWEKTYILMAFLMLLTMMSTLIAPRATEIQSSASNLYQTTKLALVELLRRDKVLLLLLFIALYKLGDALALSLMTNFLLHGLGFTLTEVGLAY